MKLDPLLSKAASLAKKRDYDGAIKILKAEEDRYYGSFIYYYLYAIICLHSGSHMEARSYFESAKKIKIKDHSVMLGLAALYLKRLNTVQAVDYYIDVQEIDPKNKTAKKALSVIRKHSSTEQLSVWLTPKRLSKLFPPIPAPIITQKTVLTTLLALFAAFILVFGLLVRFRVLESPFKGRGTRPTTEFALSGQERSAPVETGGSYMYILTRDEATTLYDRALSLFSAYRDEGAKININRILESNASESLKNKARLLLTYMEVPGFDNFKQTDNPSFADVKNEPVVYRNVHVIWKGMATNVNITDENMTFDFLVGYDTRRTLEGIVPVVFDKPFAINTERPLEVLGKIVLTSSYTDIILEGVAIHQSGRLEN
ncbi:MAG: tetratricopeptide repeat protein [Treponema sp.]|jgi:tetratricopeptide (TPR) repeat protein|nr:tetratricopeptide repeat protein [Treponema sp.]